MKNINLTLFLLVCLLQQSIAQITKPIGTNLNEVTYYSTELVFTDIYKQSAPWITSNSDGSGPWDTNINIPLNSKGYPLEIPYNDGVNPPQKIKTLVASLGANTPHGQYRLIVTGTGKVRLQNGATGTYNCPIDVLINVTNDVILEITQSAVADPINDIKFILPNYVNTYQTQPYTNEFLDFIDDFQVLRFMDWTKTNGSQVTTWSQRSKFPYHSQHQSTGVAWEEVILLANATQKDIWINIPHKADDDYITNLANLLKTSLNPNLKIYLEFSNEVWNGSFIQHSQCGAMGLALGYTGEEWTRAWKFTAKRSADIFHIFKTVFGNDNQFVKLMPSQAGADGWLSNQLVTYFNDPFYNPNGATLDAIAIAPYFGGEVANQIVTDGLVDTITTDEIITRLQNSLPTAYARIDGCKTVAANHGLDLICYEGGQHLVATGANVNNTALTAKLTATNHHAGMQDLYCQYFNYWYENVGNMFCHFTSHGMYSKWGSWGVKESMTDVLNPKYLGLQNCVFNANLAVNEYDFDTAFIKIYPNPATNQINFSVQTNVQITNTIGQVVSENKNVASLDITNQPSGIYFLIFTDNTGKVVQRSKIIKN